MDPDHRIKLAVYQHFAESARRPSPNEIAQRVNTSVSDVLAAYQRLRAQRVLLLEPDCASIRMAPPFSGVPTQHTAVVGSKSYFANCAWDSLGTPAALQQPGVVHSRCEQTLEPFTLNVGLTGPEPSDWLFHCLVPAAHWWRDLVFT